MVRTCTMTWDAMTWEEDEQVGVVFGETPLQEG